MRPIVAATRGPHGLSPTGASLDRCFSGLGAKAVAIALELPPGQQMIREKEYGL